MTPEQKKKHDKQLHALGDHILGIINDLQVAVPSGDVGYGRKRITFPGGEVYIIVVKGERLADAMEKAAEDSYRVESVTPRSQRN
jgi:hypothetical protein